MEVTARPTWATEHESVIWIVGGGEPANTAYVTTRMVGHIEMERVYLAYWGAEDHAPMEYTDKARAIRSATTWATAQGEPV